MNFIVKPAEIVERAKDLSRTNLLFIFGIIKAASIGLAVTVFLQLFINLGAKWSWQSILTHLPNFLQWSVSYLSLLVTFDGAMFATIFLTHIPKKSESFFTFLLVGTEALQFAILSPTLVKESGSPTIMSVMIEDWWYAIFCFYSIFMFCIVHFGRMEIKKSRQEFSSEIRPILDKYLKSFQKGKVLIVTAFLIALLSFIIIVLNQNDGFRYWVRIVSGLIFSILIFYAFFLQHKQRLTVEKLFRRL